MHGCGGHVWLWGGMHGCRGHALLPGACMDAEGGMHGRGGACIGYDEIQSMSGRYASYWNAFLFDKNLCKNYMKIKEIEPREGARY